MPPPISFVVPVRPGSPHLDGCLERIGLAAPPASQVIVVIDGCPTPSDRAACARFAVEPIALPTARGPAAARNAGIRAARSDVVMFVDDDVLLCGDAPDVALRAIRDQGYDAVFGRYTELTPARGAVTQLANLHHSFVHLTHAGPAQTFWGGCSAARGDALREVGGFDEDLRYCEDIALGRKLVTAGRRILIAPGLMGTHLKSYRVRSWLHTQLLGRALPWSRLILDGRAPFGALNTDRSGVASTAASLLAAATLAAGLVYRPLLAVTAASLAALLLVNARLVRFVLGRQPALAAPLLPYLVAHHLLGCLGLGLAVCGLRPAGRRDPASR
jgi:GT2 family glycosyltransferase